MRKDWKLLRNAAQWELYNVEADIGEERNLAATEQARMLELREVWE